MSKSERRHLDEIIVYVEAVAAAFKLGPAATSLLPSLCNTLRCNGWEFGFIDQCYCEGFSHRSKGGAVSALQKAGVITLERMEYGATFANQKKARLTPKAREVVIAAGAVIED